MVWSLVGLRALALWDVSPRSRSLKLLTADILPTATTAGVDESKTTDQRMSTVAEH